MLVYSSAETIWAFLSQIELGREIVTKGTFYASLSHLKNHQSLVKYANHMTQHRFRLFLHVIR